MMIADFHLHTNFSDGKMDLPDLIDLFGKRGFGAIAVTDHICEQVSVIGKAAKYLGCSLHQGNFQEYMDRLAAEKERAWKKYRMLVISGVEFTKNSISNHRSAHMLALGIHSYIDPNLDIPELCKAVHAQGGLTIAAHPVSTQKREKQTYHLWDRKEELTPCFDAWEVASGPYLFQEVLRSGLPMIASSDLHHPRQINSWKTVLQCEREEQAIFQAIRRQELEFTFYKDSVHEVENFWSPMPAPFPVT